MDTRIQAERAGHRLGQLVAKDPLGSVWRGRMQDGVPAWFVVSADRVIGGGHVASARRQMATELALRIDDRLRARPLLPEDDDSDDVLTLSDEGLTLLAEMIPEQGMRVAPMIDTMLALARLTAGLHAAGILHRDLRPARLLIGSGDEGAQCLCLDCATTHWGQSGLAAMDIGASPHYAAPELTGRIEVPIDDPADLYSLGVTFAEMISGKALFADTDLPDLSYAHVARDIPDFDHARHDLPVMLARITRRLLHKDPDDRYSSAFGLVRDLERCADQFARSGVIREFDLSARGITTRFRLGDRLYGREAEQARLLAAVDDGLLQGKRTVVSVSGPSGIGKTAFVMHMHWHHMGEGLRLLSGKFDRFKRDQPYLAFIQAAQALLRPILSADEAALAGYRVELQDRLGRFAGLLTDLIPELAILIGPQPTPEDIPPAEANRRFIGVVGRFIDVFATQQTPMILFLDDVQWADHASLHLLQAIARMPALQHFMLILGYRSNEVDPAHPAWRVIHDCHGAAERSDTIDLGPLTHDHVAQLLEASLARDRAELCNLARHVHGVSRGNAFFMREYLTSLAASSALFFDPRLPGWQFDLAALTGADVPASVAELLTERLQGLPRQTLNLLESASCVGSTFDLETLAWVTGLSLPTVAALLSPAIDATVIRALDTDHAVFAAMAPDTETAPGQGNAWYKFRHDQIRQSVHDRLSTAARTERHLRIARLMLRAVRDQDLPRRAVEIFGHVAVAGISDLAPDETERFAHLGLVAAEQAQLGLAFDTAWQYLGTVQDIMGGGWNEAHEALCLRLYRSRAKCAFAQNDRDAMEASAQVALAHTADPYDIADMQGMRIRYLSIGNQGHKAADLCIQVAAELGVRLPRHPGQAQVLAGVMRTVMPLGRQDLVRFADLPEARDARVRAAVQLMAQSAPAAYFAEPNLFPVLAASATRLSLQYGLNPRAPYCFAMLGLVLCGGLGLIDRGYSFGELAMKTAERYDGTHQSKPKFVFDTFIRHWKEPLANVVNNLTDSWLSNREAGDQEDATYCAGVALYADFLSGRHVDTTRRHPELIDYLRRTEMPHVKDSFLAWGQLLQLLGMPDLPAELSGDDFDYPGKIAEFQQLDNGVQIAISSIAAGVLDHLAGRYQRAEERFSLAAKNEIHLFAQVLVPGLAFLRALNAYWLAEADPAQSARMRRIAWRQTLRLKYWNRSGPANLAHRLALLNAERLAGKGQHAAALMALHDTCTLAGPQAPLYAYLAHRRRFCILRKAGHLAEAREAARQAASAVQAWGAPGLAHAICAEAGIIDGQADLAGDAGLAATDLQGFMELVGTLTEETASDQVLARIATLAMRAGNADFCALALMDEQGGVSMSCHSGDNGKAVSASVPLRPVIDLCLRTLVTVQSDAPEAEVFAADFDGALPKSLLCVPMLHGDKLLGALYLHSQFSRHVFAPSRRTLVEALAKQAAIGLQNARLLEDVQKALESQKRQTRANQRFVPDHLMQVLGQTTITDVELNQYAQTEMTAVFVDIRGSTSIAEDIGAKRTIEMINHYLEHVQPAIAAHGGFVGNYMGDGLLALFPDGPDLALFGVAAMARGLAGYNANRGDLPHLAFGAGLHLGPLTLGMIGDPDHIQVGVLGTPVNVAARLEELNKEFDSRILVSEACVARLDHPERHSLRSLGKVQLRGLRAPLGIYELLDIHDETQRLALLAARDMFERAVDAMRADAPDLAADLFSSAEAAAGHDPVAARMARHCRNTLLSKQ